MFKLTLRLIVLTAALLSACSWKSSESPCPASFCANHGQCTNSDEVPVCACDPGYTGVTCGSCAAGFHRAGSETCVADDACATETCGGRGSCSLANGEAVCACEPGYGGPRCATCAAGYRFVPDLMGADAGTPELEADAGEDDGESDGGSAVPTALDAGPLVGTCELAQVCSESACPPFFACNDSTGVVTCTCNSGLCSACAESTCNGHGICDDSSGFATCTCANGYVGPRCDGCYAGYARSDNGECRPTELCQPQTCSGGGTCRLSASGAVCDCGEAYDGDRCERCADGFHRSAFDGTCTADETCEAASCGAHQSCDDSTGAIVCTCLPGYAGTACLQCYPGFHFESGECLLDERCTATSCGGGICDDGTGQVVCQCDPGFSGDHCEFEQDACGHPSPCGTGQCVNLRTSYQCLCTDGSYGQSCQPGPTVSGVSPKTGDLRGGTQLTITGSTFMPGTTVTVGAKSVSVTFISANELRVTTPVASTLGAADLVVVNPNGQKAHATFTYTPIQFTATGSSQSFTVPAGVSTLYVQAWGAGGGMGQDSGARGGAGGYTSAHVTVTPGETYTLIVGRGGQRISSPTAAGAGGGYSGFFLGTPEVGAVVVLAGGGGGAGYGPGDHGGNGGGDFGGAGLSASGGLGGNMAAGGIGGCLANAQCGQNGAGLQGGGGGVPSVGTPRVAASFGGGGAVGVGPAFTSAGGGGGFFGGGGGAGGGGGGGGGGAGFVSASAADTESECSTEPGSAPRSVELGYLAGTGEGGSLSKPTGGDGLILVSW